MFNYAKENTGGYVDFDYYDLSDVLTSDGKAVDTSKLRSAIDQADSLQSAEYPMDEWDKMLTLLDKAKQRWHPILPRKMRWMPRSVH